MSQHFNPKSFALTSGVVFVIAITAVYFVFWNNLAILSRAIEPVDSVIPEALFRVDGDKIVMSGSIGSNSAHELSIILLENPEIKQILMADVGSSDLEAVLE